jgi:hypothetical protein
VSDLPGNDHLQSIDKASAGLLDLLAEGLTNERGLHLETYIAAAASLAGVALLRSSGIDVSALTPGTPVLIDEVNDRGVSLMGFMRAVSHSMGINAQTGWGQPVADDHQPLVPMLELEARFEQPFVELCDRLAVPAAFRAHVAAMAVVKAIKLGEKVLDPEISKAVALSTVVAASKTVPARGNQ